MGDSEFNRLINLAAEPVATPKLSAALQSIATQICDGQLVQSDHELVLSVFDSQWSSARLKAAEKSGLTEEQIHFLDFYDCLAEIIVRLRKDPSQGTITGFVERLKRITRWLTVLESSCIANESSTIKDRIVCKATIVTFIRACVEPDTPSELRDGLRHHDELFGLVWRLWVREVEDPRFLPNVGDDSSAETTMLVDAFISHQGPETAVNILGQKPDELARITLLHVATAMNKRQIDFDHLRWALHVCDTSSEGFSTRVALLSQNVISSITRAMTAAITASTSPAGPDIAMFQWCCVSIKNFSKTLDTVPYILQLVDSDILAILFNGDRLLARMPRRLDNDQLEDSPRTLLKEVIGPYLIYPSILQAVKKYMKKSKNLDVSSRNSEEFRHAWEKMMEWGNFISIATQQITKQNPLQTYATCAQCGKSDIHGEFKRCTGCLNSIYCSTECQRVGWKNGHEKYCKELQQLRAAEKVPEMSKREWKFIKRFVLYHLRLMYNNGFSEAFNTCKQAYAELDLDYTKVPPSAYFLRMDGGSICEHRLRRMKESEARGDQNIKVRADIPRGKPKTLMFAIELETIQGVELEVDRDTGDGDFDRSVKMIEFYQDCCSRESIADGSRKAIVVM
ncbi:unnamed protein product [Somion occarium]|uniref:MYND-type domain-containing protein n=1 Tax=Somion occarium TaxID=3059160 RepID=A0ABP1DY06_9APHY